MGHDGYSQKPSIPVNYRVFFPKGPGVIPARVTDDTYKTDEEYLEWLGYGGQKRGRKTDVED